MAMKRHPPPRGSGQPPSPETGIAGLMLALAIYGYTTARLEVLLIAILLAIVWGIARTPGWWRALVPIAAGYVVLGTYALLNPGALTGRFSAISIWSDGAPLGTVVGRFLANYLAYFSPSFLFTQGDINPRQNTEIGGMLLWVMAPLVIAGILVCWQRRREPFIRFAVAGILLAPIAAALTNNGTPHALRSSGMFPFLVILAVLGADGLRSALAGRIAAGRVVAAVLAVGLVAQAVFFTVDLYAAYPHRAAPYFDTGEIAALTTARAIAGTHPIYVSNNLDQPYIEAFFAYLPPPPRQQETDVATPGLAAMGMQLLPAEQVYAGHPAVGDVLVLSQFDPPPPSGWTLVAGERGPANLLDASAPRPVIESVYRFGG